jgi:hypothetical protein
MSRLLAKKTFECEREQRGIHTRFSFRLLRITHRRMLFFFAPERNMHTVSAKQRFRDALEASFRGLLSKSFAHVFSFF